MVTHQIIRFPYGSWFATRDLPLAVTPSKSVRETDTKNRPRIAALMTRVWTVGIFNRVLTILAGGEKERSAWFYYPPTRVRTVDLYR